MMDLRANTAVDVLIGPFIDITDGNTTEDALTLTAAEIKLSKNGQALTLKSDVTAAAFDDDGYYNCELDATDTNAEGNLVLIVHQAANALPVRHEFNVLSEAAWDNLYAADNTVHAQKYSGPRGPGVYLNDAAANTNTVVGTDGTFLTPVSTIAAAKTLADALSIDRIYLVNDSTITLAATMQDYEFVGIGELSYNSVNLGSQDVDHSYFENVIITGTQGGAARIQARQCVLSVILGMEITALGCILADAGVLTLRNDCCFDSCWSAVAGSGTPELDINSVANINVYCRHYSGGLEVSNAVATTVMSFEADGHLIIAATCTSLTAVVRGNCEVTDNGTTSSISRDAALTLSQISSGSVASVSGAVGSVTAGVTLAAGAITNASLAGNMEIVYETDFATNYNATRDAWATNVQDFVGTSAADPFNGQVVAASVTGAVGSVTGAVGSVTGAVGSVTGNVGGNVVGTVASVVTKTGYSLAAGGLDSVVVSDLAGIPATTAKVVDAVAFLFMGLRNKIDITATTKEIHRDGGTVLGTKTLSDNGTTYSETKMA